MSAFAFAIFAGFAGYAEAGSQCYSSNQLEAEQLLRLHSELMVVAIACRTSTQGDNLVSAYTGFTRDHIDALHDAEQTLMAYYSSIYGGDGVEQLDKLRTKLGNEYGQKMADVSAPIFCQMYRDKVAKLCTSSVTQVHDEVMRMMSGESSFGKLCTAGPQVAKHGQ